MKTLYKANKNTDWKNSKLTVSLLGLFLEVNKITLAY